MGSYYDLRVGGYSIISTKWPIEEAVLSFFVEADKTASQSAPDPPDTCANVKNDDGFVGYCSNVAAIADRLDVMGFTPELAKAGFTSQVQFEIEQAREHATHWRSEAGRDETYSPLIDNADKEVEFLSGLSFERWVESMRRLKRECIRWPDFDSDEAKYPRDLDALELRILKGGCNNEDPHLGFYCSDLRFLVRAFLICAEPTDKVVLDCTDMVSSGYFQAQDPITDQARISITAGARAVEKILVLTEGRSDSRILQATLCALYQHLRDFLSFLDHDSFSVAGGAGNLLNLLRGFAGAGVSNRVLALFDNDAAGSVQLAKARAIELPQNFRALQLPHLDFAKRYPTLGPTGPLETDINGSACSIELYLGRLALTEKSGNLMPIQWTGYERSISRYQGELEDKLAVQERYLNALSEGHAETANIELVFSEILRAFRA